jgi:hypothetical protein
VASRPRGAARSARGPAPLGTGPPTRSGGRSTGRMLVTGRWR